MMVMINIMMIMGQCQCSDKFVYIFISVKIYVIITRSGFKMNNKKFMACGQQKLGNELAVKLFSESVSLVVH